MALRLGQDSFALVEFGDGSIVNDVVIGHTDSGILLRVDSIAIGRDAQVKAGTVSSGSDRTCLLYTSPSPRDPKTSRMPSSA